MLGMLQRTRVRTIVTQIGKVETVKGSINRSNSSDKHLEP